MRLKSGFGLPLVVLALLSVSMAHAQVNTIRINEVLANNLSYSNSDGSVTDLIELYNSGASAVDLTGSSITDSNLYPRRYTFTNGTVIMQPGEFLTIMCDSRFSNNLAVGSPPFGVKVPFGIKASGGYLFFYGPDDVITPISQVEYGLQIADFSIGHVTDGNGPWELTVPTPGGPNVPTQLGSRLNVRINEWMVKGSPDYLELFNPTNKPVAIGGMYLSDTSVPVTKFRIPDLSFIGTGPMGGFLKFNCDGQTTAPATPKYPADETNFKLSDNELLVFTDTNGVGNVDFIPNWGTIHTSDVSSGRLPDGTTNIVFFPKINDYNTSSPGEPNFLIFPYTNGIIVNEILSHTDPPYEDAVEFQNRASTNINISGWWLSNSRLNRKRYQIPGAAALLPGRYRVIYEGATNGVGFNSPTALDPFTFNSAHGDNIVLSQVDASMNLTGYIVYEEFESAANGVSFGHYETSVTNDYKFVAMSSVTFGTIDPTNVFEFRQGTGQSNTYPRVGPIVINEIMYRPTNTVFIGGTNNTLMTNQNPAEEFIELRNITSETVPLYTIEFSGAAHVLITNFWRLQRAISFNLPLTNMPPNSFCVVVGFNPYTNADALANFRTRFNVSNDVPIFGPWEGQLNDAGDAIELYRPDPVQQPPHPDAGFVPFIRIDKVNYNSSPQWPKVLANTGHTLQRKNSLRFGNDPINWAADNPNPGRASVALQDTDGDGMPDAWEIANGLNPNDPTDASLDPDGDGINNVSEYAGGTNPHDPNSFLSIAEIVPYEGTNVAVRFLAYSNATYTVQYRNSLNPGSDWQRVGDVPAAPTNRVVEMPDATAWKKGDRYYRVIAPAAN